MDANGCTAVCKGRQCMALTLYSLSIQRELHFKVTHANRIYVYKFNNILRLEWAALYENLRIDSG